MKAKVVDIEAKQTTIKLDTGRFVTIPNARLNFDYKLGDTIIVEKDGAKFYFLPQHYLFGDDEDEPQKKRLKPTQKFVAFICITLGLTILIAPLVSLWRNHQDQEAQQALTDCLADAANLEFQTETFDASINCYKNHPHPEKYVNEIADFETKRDTLAQDECVRQAETNYAISQEEIDASGTDLAAGLILLKRLGARYEKQKTCYETYKQGDYQNAIRELEAKINENNSYITDAETAQTAQNYASQNYRSFNCFTTSYGSSAHTSCY